jgi:integrase
MHEPRGAHNPEAGSSNLPPATIKLTPISKQKLFDTLWSLRSLSRNTQRTYAKLLKIIDRNADLNDPLSVERCVFEADCKNKSRNNFFCANRHYCDVNGIEWSRPKLREEVYPVKIPTEERINLIIGSCSPRYATIYHLSKHGLRPHEISKVSLRDLNLERGKLVVRS